MALQAGAQNAGESRRNREIRRHDRWRNSEGQRYGKAGGAGE